MNEWLFTMRFDSIAVGALTVWRLTHLMHAEDGPYRIAARLRGWAGVGFWGEALACFYCLSLWLAAPVALVIGVGSIQRLLLWPALSGAACLLERVTAPAAFPGVVFEHPQGGA